MVMKRTEHRQAMMGEADRFREGLEVLEMV